MQNRIDRLINRVWVDVQLSILPVDKNKVASKLLQLSILSNPYSVFYSLKTEILVLETTEPIRSFFNLNGISFYKLLLNEVVKLLNELSVKSLASKWRTC